MSNHYTVIPKKEDAKPLSFPTPVAQEQYAQPIGPHRETTVEKIKRHATDVGQSVDNARKKVEEYTQKPMVKKTIQHLKERGDNISGQRRPPHKPQPAKTKMQPTKTKQPKPVGRMQAPYHKPIPISQRPPPKYVVQNGKTFAAQLDPFGIQGGVIDNYQKLTKPASPFGKRSPKKNTNPFGIG